MSMPLLDLAVAAIAALFAAAERRPRWKAIWLGFAGMFLAFWALGQLGLVG